MDETPQQLLDRLSRELADKLDMNRVLSTSGREPAGEERP